MITTEQIKDLRDQTGVSIMQCKKALEEAKGDIAKAIVILEKKSGESSLKRKDKNFNAGTVQSYIHATGNIGTMVILSCETDFVSGNNEFKSLARDIAMHITATNPRFMNKDDITEDARTNAREVFQNEVKDKPKDMQEKILEGKLATYFSEMVLLDQPFIKDPSITIQGLIDKAVQKFGEKIALTKFSRFQSS
ncbi:MAG TPA: elongation factor Ts [Candidatus Paceibacterota bacterium]